MNGVSGGGGAVGKRRGWNLAKTKKMMVGLATTEHEFSVVAPPPPPPRQSRPPPPSMTRMPFPDDDDPIWGSTYWPDDDDHDNDDVNAVEKAKQVIGRGAKFASVIEACAVVPKFWLHLKSIKYVSMMTCVCKHTRRIMDPDEHHHHLPFWGVWTLFMPPQPLKNIDKMMHVTR